MVKKIVEAPVPKRAFAAIFDLALTVFVGLGIFALSQTIASSTKKATALKEEIISYQLGSGLYQEKEGEVVPYDDYANYAEYESMLVSYYTVYLKSGCPESGRADYDVYWYNVHVLGLPDAKGLYANDTIAEPAASRGSFLFEYSTASGSQDVEVLGVPKSTFYKDGVLTQEAKEALLEFYYSASSKNAYYNAGLDLTNRVFYANAYDAYVTVNSLYPLVIAAFSASFLFYFVAPMIFPNGETLGKKILHLCLIRKDGFSVRKGNVLLRSLPPVAFITVLFFFVPFIYAVMAFSLLLFVSYMLALFTPSHSAIHDFLGHTAVIDEKESIFFRTQQEEDVAEDAAQELAEAAIESRKQAQAAIDEENKYR